MLERRQRGFTLPEILVTVGILAMLAVIVIIAIDPVRRFEDARDSRRLSDTQAIAGAIHQYTIDHKGMLPPGLDKRERQIGSATNGCELKTTHCVIEQTTDCVHLAQALKPYLDPVPNDPSLGSPTLTHYSVRIGDNNAVIVRACGLQNENIE